MISPRPLLAVLALALCFGCASRLQSQVRFDESVDFTRLKTFAFTTSGSERGAPENRALARTAIENELRARGLRPSDGAADVLVRFQMGRRAKVAVSGRGDWGTVAGIEIELLDPSSGEVIWDGFATETWYESMEPAAEIRKAVALVLSQYPPGP